MSRFNYFSIALIILFSLNLLTDSIAQSVPPVEDRYFGFSPPGDSAIIFAPGFISIPGRVERTPNYLPDYSEFYFTRWESGRGTLYSTQYSENWSTPSINNSFKTNTADVSISEDGKQAIFISWSGQYIPGVDTDAWVIDKAEGGWLAPVKLPFPVNTTSEEWGASISLDHKTVYMCKGSAYKSDIVKYVLEEDGYKLYTLPWINTASWEWDPFIPDDDSYMIFKSDRPGGYGGTDLYISYKKEDASYTNPKNLGPRINNNQNDDGGSLSPDGEYFIFARNNQSTGESDIYWVRSTFIENLRTTNFEPYILEQIPNQFGNVGLKYFYQIAERSFIDDDGRATLTFSVSLLNGNPLPEWLEFDAKNLNFSGVPTNKGELIIKITATDTAGASATDVFNLSILDEGAKSYYIDGILDKSATLLASNGSNYLYTDWDEESGILYVATKSAAAFASDIFIFISDSDNNSLDAPWGKSGKVSEYGTFLANESDNNWAGWFEQNSTVSAKSSNFIEGTINIKEEFNEIPESIFLALGVYETNSGGRLIQQVPEGNGDLNIDITELEALTTAVSTEEVLGPRSFELKQNYPNPFNPSTTIDFTLNQREHVKLQVFDLLGREITTLVDEIHAPGSHSVDFRADGLSSGLYLYLLTTDELAAIKKMTLIK